jgi:hypothetical protein
VERSPALVLPLAPRVSPQSFKAYPTASPYKLHTLPATDPGALRGVSTIAREGILH